jgi:hypothetical protein
MQFYATYSIILYFFLTKWLHFPIYYLYLSQQTNLFKTLIIKIHFYENEKATY